MKVTAILLAAGKGRRMGGDVPKQYMDLCGRPLLSYALETLERSEVISDIVAVVPAGDEAYVQEKIAAPLRASKVRCYAAGGAERCESVGNGLEAVTWPCDYVFIHDGARPFVSVEILQRLYAAVRETGAAVAAVKSKDTVKLADAHGFVAATPDRENVWIVQTPQCFDFRLAAGAYAAARGKEPVPTDDAMVVETYTHHAVKLVEGSYSNIKITSPDDIAVAEAILQRNRK
ncbi:MAG: 2-C-methyl-D-erythritol 4-phosphate cytidylyltransferase [Lachnospiraceae bacterium]|jgi:2-C-methyl-D-erythritol 4-phosphate cytidylyltransferase|nr:2-C-methyl-D-erythritol 4-phosphate cytidylyltransferase [Lachnospiraceae bacterium]